MALTRIHNNQITDATIVASSKLLDNSISAGKLANNLNYGSNLTITGNLTVNGTSTTLDTVNTLIEDPILLLAKDQTGSAAFDIGFVGERGDDTNIAWIWDENESQFAAGFTSGDGSGNTVTLSSYADAQVADITMVNLAPSGNVTTALNASSSIEAGTSITAGTTITATGNVAGGNVTTAGQVQADNLDATNGITAGTTITATGNVVGGNLTTAGQVAGDNADITNGITAGTTITATGNVAGGNITTGGAMEATGLISSGTTITATGNVAGGNITTGGAMEATGLISSGTTITATGNVAGGNLTTAGQVAGDNADITNGITAGTTIVATGNVSGGNLTTAGQVAADNADITNGITAGTTITATGNVSGGNLTTAGQIAGDNADITNGITAGTTITATGNVSGGNLTTANAMDSATINTTGEATLASAIVSDLTSGRVVLAGTSGAIEDSANATFDGSTLGITGAITASTTITATGNVAGGNLTTANAMDSATINTTGEATLASAIVSDLTSGRVVLAGTSGAIEDSSNMTFDGSTLGITGAITATTTITATGNVAGGNVTTGGRVDATGTIEGGTLTDGTASINSGAITGATSGSFSTTLTATGNVTGGNVNTAGMVAATGNVSGGNITTGGDIDATGDVAGASVTTNVFQGSLPVISSTGTNADISINPNGTGDIDVNNAKIVQLATPTADGDAANKAYVDSVAEGLDIKASVHVATTAALAAVTYDNGTGGVGATLTADANGEIAAVDGVTLVNGDRVLIKDQASQLQNGIYVTTSIGDAGNPFVFTRAGDMDGSPASEIPGAFTFVEEGSTNADAGFVCTTNAPVTMGSTAIIFTQFSGAGSIVAGDGLSKAGETLDVNVDDVTTAIVGDAVTVKVSANLTTPNIGVANGDSLTVTGNVDGVSSNFSGVIVATGNVTGGNLNTGGAVVATGLISSGSTITATGNVTGGNLTTANAMDSATINTTGEATLASAIVSDLTAGRVVLAGTSGAIEDSGNFTFDGSTAAVTGAITASTTITATGNVAGGNLTTAGQVAADNADITNGITAGTTITATGNVSGGNLTTGGDVTTVTVTASGAIAGSTTITATGNVVGGNVTTAGQVAADNAAITNGITAGTTIVATGNVTGGNLTTAGQIAGDNADITNGITAGTTITATGNVAGGNITTAGQVAADNADITNGITAGTTIVATGNVSGGNLTTANAMDSATINTTGEATLASAIVSDLTSGRVVLAGTSGAIEDSGNFTFDGSTAAVTGAITASTTITATGNVAGGNVTTGGAVEATGLISSGSTITATGNVAGGNLTTAGQVAADNADITNGITAGTTITATGNVAGGNITTAGAVDATGDVTGANLKTGNITIATDDITSAGTAITVNQNAQDVDFIVEGSSNANLLTIDAGTDTIVIGSATTTTGATLKVDATDSQMIPVGTTAQRPTGVTGMIRFNTTLDQFEFYDSNSWTTAGSDFTVIASQTFSGDNSTTAFTLGSTQTTASCIVSINGVVQEPTTAYAVSGTTLTFTEAPLAGDTIEVRQITTTTTITQISSADQTSIIDAQDAGDVNIKGNIIPSANATYDIGSASERYNELFLSGSSITLGNVVIKNTGGNAVGFFGPDGVTPGVIDANVEIAGDSIVNGTSSVDFSGTNGDVRLTAGGTQSLTVISTGANVVGDFATTGDVRFLDSDNSNYVGFQAPATVGTNLVWTLPATDGSAGQALVTDASGTLSFAAAGATVTGDTSTDTDFLLYFASTTSGALTAVKQDSGLIYNPSTGSLSSAVFIGDLTGNADTCTTASGVAANSVALGTDTTGNYVATGAVSGTGLSGSSSSEGGTFTVTSNATSANTGSTIVARDGSGDFTAGVITATATAARYADLAEKYASDGDIEAGTVVHFAGEGKVAECDIANCRAVAGIVSTDPAYLMNSDADGVALAIAGRVPTKVTGVVNAGDLIVSAGNGRGMANNDAAIGTVIGKAIEANEGGEAVIEVLALMM